MFKLVQRSCEAKTMVIGASDRRSAIEECTEKYTFLSHPPSISNTAIYTFTPPLISGHNMFTICLLLLVSPEQVASYIKQLLTTKSCGEDGNHMVQLKDLLSTLFISHLFSLFNMSIVTARLPNNGRHLSYVCFIEIHRSHIHLQTHIHRAS